MKIPNFKTKPEDIPSKVNAEYATATDSETAFKIPTLTSLRIDRDSPLPSSKPNLNSIIKNNHHLWTLERIYCRRNSDPLNMCKKVANYCFISVCLAFIFGLVVGVFLMGNAHSTIFRQEPSSNVFKSDIEALDSRLFEGRKLTITKKADGSMDSFSTVSFVEKSFGYVNKQPMKLHDDVYPKGMTEDMKDILKDNKSVKKRHEINKDIINNVNLTHLSNVSSYKVNKNTIIYDNIYWGPKVEDNLPEGYDKESSENWTNYVKESQAAKMELGCGRMQNRLITFQDGLQACVRYRQNTDQIQGEIFSFYVAKLLNLTNLAPSLISVVDVNDNLWQNIASDIASAQWNSNRAVVLTQFIPSLESAPIPEVFKPTERHLNKYDIFNMTQKENETFIKNNLLMNKLRKNKKANNTNTQFEYNLSYVEDVIGESLLRRFVELAQWSDLIVFDYLTANLDRIVNNLFNFQWNINIMDGPAHNLARKVDSGLLMFLDNESGLLHGYRLLKKYDVYHSLMLDNLCVFRKSTIDSLKNLYENELMGKSLLKMFHEQNNAVVRDVLPPLPEKNIKMLHERMGRVLGQVQKCENMFSVR